MQQLNQNTCNTSMPNAFAKDCEDSRFATNTKHSNHVQGYIKINFRLAAHSMQLTRLLSFRTRVDSARGSSISKTKCPKVTNCRARIRFCPPEFKLSVSLKSKFKAKNWSQNEVSKLVLFFQQPLIKNSAFEVRHWTPEWARKRGSRCSQCTGEHFLLGKQDNTAHSGSAEPATSNSPVAAMTCDNLLVKEQTKKLQRCRYPDVSQQSLSSQTVRMAGLLKLRTFDHTPLYNSS